MGFNKMIRELKGMVLTANKDGKPEEITPKAFKAYYKLFMKAARVYSEYNGCCLTDAMMYVTTQIEN